MYALTGANGHLGRLVLKHLLTQVPADQVIAITRDPQKLADIEALGVVVRRADFSDPTTLPAAFAGVTRLLIISTDVVGQRVEGHKAAIAGAVAAGVGYIAYTSAPDADPNALYPIMAEHGQTEVALAASGVQWTALRNSFYTEVLKDLLGLFQVDEHILIPEGSARHSWITREDCARAAAGALLGKLATGPVDVTGPEAFSFTDLVQRLSKLSGRPLVAQVSTDDEITAQIVTRGLPVETASFLAGLASWTAQKLPTSPTDIVEQASGTRPSPVDVILHTLVAA
jgi:NAD(P)H dehydrogenase (quinone)